MGIFAKYVVFGTIAVGGWIQFQDLPEQTLDLDFWWGPTHLKNFNDTAIYPFKVTFDDEVRRFCIFFFFRLSPKTTLNSLIFL